jgi:glycosyltransferase involved in cell wall biosynthesis
MKIYGWSDGTGGVFHYRIKEPLRGLRQLGHEAYTGQALQLKAADAYDMILVRALHNRHESKAWQALAAQGEHLLVYDLDDEIWAWNPSSSHADYWNDDRRFQAELNIQLADMVTTPSVKLAEVLARLNPNVHVLENTVPKWLTHISQPHRDSSKFIIGWEGAHAHIHDLEAVYRPVFRFMFRHPDVELHLWGPDEFADLPPSLAERVKCYGWESDVPTYYRRLAMDVCLAPLEESPFNNTKSAIRVQEHLALGIPVIASPSPAYLGYLQNGRTGYFASSSEAWESALERIYRDPKVGQRLGAAGRRHARGRWTTEVQAPQRQRIYQEALNDRTSTREAANRRAGQAPAAASNARARIRAQARAQAGQRYRWSGDGRVF